jgi:hypothetical protein
LQAFRACSIICLSSLAKDGRLFRNVCLFLFLAGPAWSGELASDIKGFWGFELVPEMACAVNPAYLELADSNTRLVMSWPRAVTYADGSVSDAVLFRVTAIDGLRISVTRERDGISAEFMLSADRQSFLYEEEGPTEGSTFARCEMQSS